MLLETVLSPVCATCRPLVAPPRGKKWEVLWSSEEPDYGGTGTAEFETAKGWHLPANTLLVLKGR